MKDIDANKDMSVESLLGQAADEFTQSAARGEHPDVEEYARRYPKIAAVIREVFPALQVMPAPASEPGSPESSRAVEPPAAGVLGDYQLIREIGRGGMGVVYEAQQLSLERRVALKVLSFAAVLDQKHLQRFKNEAHAAAQLHHTNIVPVFSVGCERGVHYYAMQFIEGQPLSAVISELRQLAGVEIPEDRPRSWATTKATAQTASTRRAAPTPIPPGSSAAGGLLAPDATSSMLETITAESCSRGRAFFHSIVSLALQAAEALQHAHERGVIHRDIKPSNLLLDTAGRLWVTDFGLATITTHPDLTLTGDIVGTIRYMSPEQALAKRVLVDHRTDIYSLGVTLYELLTLEPAYAGRDREDLLRQIAFEEPRPLRQRNRAIPRELETIVGKAMAKNPHERYATAQEMADDLRRFLEDKPILAKPPTLLDRAAKWSRRHRTVVAAAIVVLVLSVAGLAISTVMIARERGKAMQERDTAQKQRELAEMNLQTAREVVDRMLTDVSGVSSAVAPDAERIRLTLLQEALDAAKALAEKTRDPAARRDWAAAHARLGQTFAQLGQAGPAETAYRAAADVLEGLLAEAPGAAEYRVDLVEINLRLGTLLWEKRRYLEAENLARQAHAMVAEIVVRFPQSRPYRRQLAASLDLVGLVTRDTGRFPESETALRESIELRKALVSESVQSTERPYHSFEVARTQRHLADLLMKTRRREEAESIIHQSISSLQHLTNWFSDKPAFSAELARTRRWWEEAVRLADQQLATEGLAGGPPEPERPKNERLNAPPGYSRMVCNAYQLLNDALEEPIDPAEADAVYRNAVDIIENLSQQCPAEPKYRLDLAGLHRAQAARCREAWKLPEGDAALGKGITILESLVADFPDKTDYRELLEKLRSKQQSLRERMPISGVMQLSHGTPDEIAMAIELARNIDVATIAGHPLSLMICADHLSLGGDFERAEPLARLATTLDPEDGAYWRSLGWALLGLGRVEEAKEALRRTLSAVDAQTVDDAVGGCPEPSVASYLLDMVSQDRFAARWKGVTLFGSRFDPWPWFYVGVRMELEGKPEEAESAYRICESLGVIPRAHYTTKWAAFRLWMITGVKPAPR